jgi:phenylacetate-CoA ligase
MQAAVERILAFRPAYLVGYSVALDRLERAAAAHRSRLHELGITAVIGTSEGFPYPDSAERLADTFGCRVAMEYGAVEAIGMAYTHPQGGYRMFWHSYLAEAERRGERWVLRLTALYPRSLPLIRYEIGDELVLPPGSPDHVVGLVRFDRVQGRCNDYVALADGTLVHSEVFSHAVRPCAAIRGYQVVQQAGDLRLCVTAQGELSRADEAGLRQRLGRIHADLAGIAIERVDALTQTVAGKTPMIVRR